MLLTGEVLARMAARTAVLIEALPLFFLVFFLARDISFTYRTFLPNSLFTLACPLIYLTILSQMHRLSRMVGWLSIVDSVFGSMRREAVVARFKVLFRGVPGGLWLREATETSFTIVGLVGPRLGSGDSRKRSRSTNYSSKTFWLHLTVDFIWRNKTLTGKPCKMGSLN
jgi:hypothetical protein